MPSTLGPARMSLAPGGLGRSRVWDLHAGGWLHLVWCAPLAMAGLRVRSLPRMHAKHDAKCALLPCRCCSQR